MTAAPALLGWRWRMEATCYGGHAIPLSEEGCAMDIDIISYEEDLWYGLPEDRREHCKAEWLRKATAAGARRVVLRLLPDDLFPMHGHEHPYVAWQQDIDRPPECGFLVHAEVKVTLTTEAKYVDPIVRAEISRRLSSYPTGTLWLITNCTGHPIEHGRL